MEDDFRRYWEDTIALVGEIPNEKLAAKIIRDYPDLQNRAHLASRFAFHVKAGLQAAEAQMMTDPGGGHLQRQAMIDLLDVIFFILGGTAAR